VEDDPSAARLAVGFRHGTLLLMAMPLVLTGALALWVAWCARHPLPADRDGSSGTP